MHESPDRTSWHWTRREWLRLTAAGAVQAVAAGSMVTRAAGPRALGVQLYTVRDRLGDKAAETLEAIAAIGYKELEVGRADLPRLVPIAQKLGLTAVSTHLETPIVTGQWESWPVLTRVKDAYGGEDGLKRAIDEVAAHGVRYAVLPYLMATERRLDAPYYERLADRLNEAGRLAGAAGLKFGYHNHGFEFEALPDGRRALDVLAARLDPALVTLELDVFWIGVTGADPVQLIGQYAGRAELLHMKDKAKTAATATQEKNVPRDAFVEVGNGALDFAAIVKAAGQAGVKHFFVEQDHTPGDPLDSLAQSYRNLSKLI
jgi:sugar phosphate isomerase/epimerase